MYNQTFFPSAIRPSNTLPVDACQLPPDSFKTQLNTIQLMSLPTGHVLIEPLHCFYLLLFGFLLSFATDLTTSTAHTCTYTAARYCSITELAHLLDETKNSAESEPI